MTDLGDILAALEDIKTMLSVLVEPSDEDSLLKAQDHARQTNWAWMDHDCKKLGCSRPCCEVWEQLLEEHKAADAALKKEPAYGREL